MMHPHMSMTPASRPSASRRKVTYPMNDVTNDAMTPTPRQYTSDSSPETHKRRQESPATPSTVPRTMLPAPTSTPRHGYHLTNNVPHSAQYLIPEVDFSQPPRLTVVLDLDETLVCNRKLHLSHAVLRPYARDFLRLLNKSLMEVVVWTASTDDTALPVLRQLDPEGTLIEHCVFRNAHWYTEPHHTKDLRLLGRNLSRTVLIDNAPNCCKLQAHNAILVEDFTGVEDVRDTTLIGVFRVLEVLAQGVCHRGESVSSILQRTADNDEILQHVTVLPPSSYKNLDNHGAYTHTTMLTSPPQGAYFRVKRVPVPGSN